MGSVGAPVIRRIVEVSGTDCPAELLAELGLSASNDPLDAGTPAIDANAYYDLLERVTRSDDHGLPFRYADALQAEDLGVLGLAMKTAPTVNDALRRLIRYVLVLSDTLEYELVPQAWGMEFALLGRPSHRRGAALANECALAAVVSLLRRAVGGALQLRAVWFRHPAPADVDPHRSFFGTEVHFSAPGDALHFDTLSLGRPAVLADEGLSNYLLARLDDLRSSIDGRSLLDSVRGVVADSLADGQPSKSQVARQLGMSERTLHRRLADDGASFQALVTEVRREAAESLLRSGSHSLADVAFLTGFSEQSAFTRAFKRWTGQTPASFRAEGGPTQPADA